MCLYPWQIGPRFASLGFQLCILFIIGVKLDFCVGEVICPLPWFRPAASMAAVRGTILVCLGWRKDHIAALVIVLRNGKYKGLLVNVSPAFGLFVGYADEGAIMLFGHSFDLFFDAWRRREARVSMRGERDRPRDFRVQGI